MVNSKILSRFSDNFPAPGADRKIKGGPLYPVVEVIELLNPESVIAWTKDCRKDLQRLELDNDDLVKLIMTAVKNGKYLNSQWCEQKTNGPWAACDSYRIIQEEWNDNSKKYYLYEYYIKFAINKSGKCLFTVSCHLSNN
jgi:hypothetical protein